MANVDPGFLVGWRQIATYLGVAISTCHKYYTKYHLPVYTKLHPVRAIKYEIELWAKRVDEDPAIPPSRVYNLPVNKVCRYPNTKGRKKIPIPVHPDDKPFSQLNNVEPANTHKEQEVFLSE